MPCWAGVFRCSKAFSRNCPSTYVWCVTPASSRALPVRAIIGPVGAYVLCVMPSSQEMLRPAVQAGDVSCLQLLLSTPGIGPIIQTKVPNSLAVRPPRRSAPPPTCTHAHSHTHTHTG